MQRLHHARSRKNPTRVDEEARTGLPQITDNSHLSYPSPLVIPSEAEGSAVRPAAFSNPSWETDAPSVIFRSKTKLSSRPERSVVERPAVLSASTDNSHLSQPPPLVIPSEAEGSAVRPAAFSNPSWEADAPSLIFRSKTNCHPDRSAAQWRDLLFSPHPLANSHLSQTPSPCHPDRSVPGFPTSPCWQLPRVRLSVKRAASSSSAPPVSTGNPGERSGEICSAPCGSLNPSG